MSTFSLSTKQYGVIGNPVGHSLSPVIHNAGFAVTGMDAVYLPFELTGDSLPIFFKAIPAYRIAGLNVTVPFKSFVIQYCDQLTPLAKMTGAINTIISKENKLIGDTTDGGGFLQSLPDKYKNDISRQQVLVIGAGGAARSIATYLAYKNVGQLFIANRTYGKAKALAKSLSAKLNIEATSVAFDYLAKVIPVVDIVINATPLGLRAEDPSPLEKAVMERTKPDVLIYDINYVQKKPQLKQIARLYKRRYQNGLIMLLEQARLSFALWTKQQYPKSAIPEKLRRALPKRYFSKNNL